MTSKEVNELLDAQTKEINKLKRSITKLTKELNTHKGIEVSKTNWSKVEPSNEEE